MGETFTDLEMPGRARVEVLTARDVVTGGKLRYVVVWLDRDDSECGQCGQEIGTAVVECPVSLNAGSGQGGSLEERSQQHGCGEWNPVVWVEVDEYATADDVLAAAHALLDA